MVARIGCRAWPQRRRSRPAGAGFPQLQFGFDGADGFVAAPSGRTSPSVAWRALDIAAFEIAARQPRHGAGMARLVLQHMAIGLGRLADIAAANASSAIGQHFGGVVRPAMAAGSAGQPRDKGLNWLSGIAPMKPSTGWPFLKA